jgi:hypothetical protein
MLVRAIFGAELQLTYDSSAYETGAGCGGLHTLAFRNAGYETGGKGSHRQCRA